MEISSLLQMKSCGIIGKRIPATPTMISCRATKSTMSAPPPRSPFQMNGKPKNLYEILSLDYSKNVGIEEIKKAYRRKALEFHPDICSSAEKEESTKKFMEIKMAYETLSDPITREMYDFGLGLTSGKDSDSGKRGVSKEVWERQLHGLKIRSMRRMEIIKMKNNENNII